MSELPTTVQDWPIPQLRQAMALPANHHTNVSRRRLYRWYQSIAPELHWTSFESPIGTLFLAANRDGLRKVSFAPAEAQFLANLDPKAQLTKDGGEVHVYRQQLEEYFEGRRRSFSLPLDLAGLSDFQKEVLAAIDEIPAGQVRSYGDIAEQIKRPRAARAVGQALGNNPIPIVLPCHRVVASDGSLGGYAGGLKRKRQLLVLEGAYPSD